MTEIPCEPEDILPLRSDPFFWPDNPDEFLNLVQRLHEKIFDLMTDWEKRPGFAPLTAPELIAASWPVLIHSFIRLTQAASAATQEKNLIFSRDHYPFWAAYISQDGSRNVPGQQNLPDQPACKTLLAGPVKDPPWRWPLRMMRNRLQQKTIRRDPLLLFNPQHHTAVTGTDRVVQDFCRSKNLSGFYTEPSAFFRKLRRNDLRETFEEMQLINNIAAIMESILERRIALNPPGRTWLRRQIGLGLITTQRYVAQALSSPHRLPRRLVSNLGGAWNVLLRYAVQKNGGETHVIDHGCGSAIYIYPLIGLTNYAGTSAFHAFSATSKTLLEKNFHPVFRKLFPALSFDAFPHEENAFSIQRGKSSGKSLLLIPLCPIYDRGLGAPYPSVRQSLDFNARLVRELQKLGWDVTLKQHPAFMEFPPERFPEKYGAPCITKPFEDVYSDYDMLVSCDLGSTTLVPSMFSGKPLLILNNYPTLYSEDAMRLLTQRAEIHSIFYDDANRAHIDWDRLENMLAASILKAGNTGFSPLFRDDPQ